MISRPGSSANRLRLDARLVGVDDAAARRGDIRRPRAGRPVPANGVEGGLRRSRAGMTCAVKGGEPRRGKTARLAQRLPPPLVQVDQDGGGGGQLVQPLDRMQHRPAGVEPIALAAAELLAMALGQMRQVFVPGRRQGEPPATRRRPPVDRVAVLGQAGGRARRRPGLPRRRCPVPAGPRPARVPDAVAFGQVIGDASPRPGTATAGWQRMLT